MNQQIQQNIMPGPYQTFQPNQQVINPLDGRQYEVRQQNQGQGVTLVDPQTQQELMVSEQESQNLKPALKTSTHDKVAHLNSLDEVRNRREEITDPDDLGYMLDEYDLNELLSSPEKYELSSGEIKNIELRLGRGNRLMNYTASIKTSMAETYIDRLINKMSGKECIPDTKEKVEFLVSYLDKLEEEVDVEKVKDDLGEVIDSEIFDSLENEEKVSKEEVVELVRGKVREWLGNSKGWEEKVVKTLSTFVGKSKESKFSLGILANEIVEELMGEKLPEVNIVSSLNIKRGFKMNNWHETRKKLRTHSQMSQEEIKSLPTYKESVDERLKRESKYTPYEGELDEEVGRDKKTGLPMRGGGGEYEIGMTEFPKDVDKEKDPEGYGKMTMEEMDRKFEEERPHFKNEQYLPDYTKKREESDTYLSGEEKNKKIKDLRKNFPEPRYSSQEELIDSMIGKVAGDEDVTKLPIQYKDVKKAPGKDMEYVEPDVLNEVGPDVRVAIELFKSTQEEINTLQTQIQEKTKPLQQAIIDATKDLQSGMAEKAALLKTCLDMIYEELGNTKDKVGVMGEEIYAAVSREKAVAPAASLSQILKKAEQVQPQLVKEINKIKAAVESDNTKLVLEQFLYKYPVSEVQKKKLSSLEGVEGFVEEIISLIESLKQLNTELYTI